MRFADNRNKIGKYIPTVVFLIFIYGMALWFLFSPKTDYSSSEKRYLQKFPDANVEKVLSGEFGSEFETFFADQFPQRNTWVGINRIHHPCGGQQRCKRCVQLQKRLPY